MFALHLMPHGKIRIIVTELNEEAPDILKPPSEYLSSNWLKYKQWPPSGQSAPAQAARAVKLYKGDWSMQDAAWRLIKHVEKTSPAHAQRDR